MTHTHLERLDPHVLRVVHTTKIDYPQPVVTSYNEARMRPVSDHRQEIRRSQLEITPTTWTDTYQDYWGTTVAAFEVLRPHKQLKITANSVVEILPSFSDFEQLRMQCSATWEDLAGDNVLDAFAEFLTVTPATDVPKAVVDLARTASHGLEPFQAAEAICLAIRDHLEYVPGATTVHTPASEAWQHKRGVCQDMAHLSLGALRAVGIPARYVSGYLHPMAESAIGETVNGESHAWIEFWAGDYAHTGWSHDWAKSHTWVGYDPTNRKFAGTDHIVVGRGRDYGDVPPLKGIYAGSPDSAMEVTVEITRIA